MPLVAECKEVVAYVRELQQPMCSRAGCPVVLKKLSVSFLRTTPLDRSIELARTLHDHVRSG